MRDAGLAVRRAALLLLGVMGVAAGVAVANPIVLAPSPPDDPAAQGVLTPAQAQIMPGREGRLRVLKEHLSITFGDKVHRSHEYATQPPMVLVSAVYAIENPTKKDIRVVFGYPVLRHVHPSAYVLTSDMGAWCDGERADSRWRGVEEICAFLFRPLRQSIEEAISADAELRALVDAVPDSAAGTWPEASRALIQYLTRRCGWAEDEALWLVAYASLDLRVLDLPLPDENPGPMTRPELWAQRCVRFGPLAKIDERVACQFLERVAALLDAGETIGYADVVRAWGGTDMEMAVDLATGNARPRVAPVRPANDTASEKRFWLPPGALVRPGSIFGALPEPPPPMALVLYEVLFPAQTTREFRVTSKQFAFVDAAEPRSHQIAFVVHTAAMWDEFGPIGVEVLVPGNCTLRASFPCKAAGASEVAVSDGVRFAATVYEGNLEEKTGQILAAIDDPSWSHVARQVGEQLAAEEAEAERQRMADQAGPPPAVQDGGGRTVWFTFSFGVDPWSLLDKDEHNDE